MHDVQRLLFDQGGREVLEEVVMADCINRKKNAAMCNCTYAGCARHGVCCECLEYHRRSDELPACYFDKEAEKTYDRSFSNFMRCK